MPSFDIVSKVDEHELNNAVDQTNREISSRFDFKGVDASVELNKNIITLVAPTEFQIKQLTDILENKLAKRQIDIQSLDYQDITSNIKEARQDVNVQQGLASDIAKKITKYIKGLKVKVQAQIQGEQIRVTGKKRDELQAVIAELREGKFDLPLQYENFRD